MFRENETVVCLDNSRLIMGDEIIHKHQPYKIRLVRHIDKLTIIYLYGIS